MNITNLFEEFDERSREALMGYKDSFMDLNNLPNEEIGSFSDVHGDKTFQVLSNEVAMDSPFGEKSMFYEVQREIITGEIPKL